MITTPSHANYSYSFETGIKAGINMVKKNIIPMIRIDDAVKRILRVKFAMGLFEDPLANKILVDQLGSQEHRELAREAVRKSLVLIKNGESTDKPLLPLPKKSSKNTSTTILTTIKNIVDPQTEVVYEENPNSNYVKSNNFSYSIIVVATKCVVVVIFGRPIVMQPHIPLMDALVAAWLPRSEGQAVADILFRDYGFTCKLSRTWFKTVGDPHYDPLF
ncbi:hypothetical protein Q3G72_027237 [Acer saccharum]|nr:hypothetical protein Q3G72_027237 [Acer saccharum]